MAVNVTMIELRLEDGTWYEVEMEFLSESQNKTH